MLLRYRIHEWFADRCRWVQYPDIRAATQRTARRAPPAMRWEQRLGVGLVGSFGLLVSALVFAVACFVIWAVLAA